jgi:hypothetical protein
LGLGMVGGIGVGPLSVLPLSVVGPVGVGGDQVGLPHRLVLDHDRLRTGLRATLLPTPDRPVGEARSR